MEAEPTEFAIEVQPTPEGVVVAIAGELDVANAPFLRERLVEAVRESPPKVLVDLSKVGFLDSSAIGLLVSIRRRVADFGGHFSVRCGPDSHLALGRRGLLDHLNVDFAG